MSARLETLGEGKELRHRLVNDSLCVEVLSGVDARVLRLVDLTSGRNLLSERVWGFAMRSKIPYGLTTWVKGGSKRDEWNGVLNENQLGYEKVPVQAPTVERVGDGLRLTCVQEGQGLRFQKEFLLDDGGRGFRYVTKLTNLGDKPRLLQLEDFFVWNTDDCRNQTSFVVPTARGADDLRLPSYDDVDCRAVVPSEPWGAYLDRARGLGVVMVVQGIHKLVRYVAGAFAQFAGLSPEMLLSPQGQLCVSRTFYVLSSVRQSASVEIEPIRRDLVAILDRRQFVTSGNSGEDRIARLLPRPGSLVRAGSSFVLDSAVGIDPGQATSEARLFRRQLVMEHGIKLSDKPGDRAIRLAVTASPANPQAYKLEIAPKQVVVSGAPEGIQYGLQALLDLLGVENGALAAPCCTIEDAPDLSIRSMLMFAGGKDWDRVLERFAAGVLARLRFNGFMTYLGQTAIAFERPIEGVQPDANAIPEARLRQLAAELRAMHIDFIPAVGLTHILCPESQKEQTRIASAVLERVVDVLHPRFVNIAYDEMGHFSAKCDCCKGKGNHEVFVHAVSHFHRLLKEHGSAAAIWCDMLLRKPGDPLGWLDDASWAVANLPKDVVLNDYHYGPGIPDYEQLATWKKAGFQTVTGTPWSTEENVLNWCRSIQRHGATGLMGSSWADGPSPTGVGHAEGLVWTATYGWRIGQPAFADAQGEVIRRARLIAQRRWDLGG